MIFVMACGTKRYQVIGCIVVTILVTMMHLQLPRVIAYPALSSIASPDRLAERKAEFSRIPAFPLTNPHGVLWPNLEGITASARAENLLVSLYAVLISPEGSPTVLAFSIQPCVLPPWTVTSRFEAHLSMPTNLGAKVLGANFTWPTQKVSPAEQTLYGNPRHHPSVHAQPVTGNSTEVVL